MKFRNLPKESDKVNARTSIKKHLFSSHFISSVWEGWIFGDNGLSSKYKSRRRIVYHQRSAQGLPLKSRMVKIKAHFQWGLLSSWILEKYVAQIRGDPKEGWFIVANHVSYPSENGTCYRTVISAPGTSFCRDSRDQPFSTPFLSFLLP